MIASMRNRIRLLFVLIFTGSLGFINATSTNTPQWPLELEGAKKQSISIYQPQIESFEGNKLTARAAVSVKETPTSAPVFGAVWFDCKVDTDRDARTVTLQSVDVTSAKFPQSDPSKVDALKNIMKRELSKKNYVVSLDQLLASLEALKKEGTSVAGLKNEPPTLIFKTTPSALVVIEGEPRLKDASSGLMQVINTSMLMLYDPALKIYYLKSVDKWRSATSLQGTWEIMAALPKNLDAYIKAQPRNPQEPPAPTENVAQPAIVISTVPAELVVTKGEPEYQTLTGTELLYVSNADHDLFRLISTQELFIIVSGRWYKAPGLNGPWVNVLSDKLPAEFAKIPVNSPKAEVRANIAGTVESKEAVLDATIPQTSTVKKSDAKLEVVYDGEPKFKKTEGKSPVEYAENTPNAVFKLYSRYYSCDNAVWFESKSPKGPWTVCTSVPHELYEIPPSCPHYNCTYVKVYDATPDVVVVGYTPGYMGCYVYGPTVVYGTGYYYSPWVSPYYYYPYPYTYGVGVHYYPAVGWGVGIGVYPHYGVTIGIGGGGYHGGGNVYVRNTNVNINTGNRNNININNKQNIYNNRNGGSKPSNMDRKPNAGLSDNRGPNNKAGRSDNLMADRDGNVYRNSDKGWEQRGKDSWSKPSGGNASSFEKNRGDLNSQQQVRDRSAGSSSMGSRPSSGSYGGSRPSGGSRGGGGGSRGGGRR